jgi:hypothetical protein
MGDKPAMGRLKEEIVVRDYVIWETDAAKRRYRKCVDALIAAVRADERERCAKVAEGCGNDELYEAIADAVRKGKPVQQCTYCGMMKDNITSNGECMVCRGFHL